MGGSLAGMASALRLAQLGYEPRVLDKSRFPRPKLCGEFLGPDAFPVLAQLGVLPQVEASAWGPVEKARFYNLRGEALEVHLSWMDSHAPHAMAIPRETLDTLLVTEARARGIALIKECRVLSPINANSGRFEIASEVRSPDGQVRMETFPADHVIDATGRNGRLSIGASPVPEGGRNRDVVGIQCHVRVAERWKEKDLSMFLFLKGYGGIQPIADDMANVCMLVEASLGKQMRQDFTTFIQNTIGQNPVASRMLRNAEKVGDFNTTADLNMNWHSRKSGDGLIRIGDALITVDPFTGSGMAHALQTGVLAAECLHHGIRSGWDYGAIHQHYHREYASRFKTRLQLLRLFRPALNSPGLQRVIWPLLPPFLPTLTRLFR